MQLPAHVRKMHECASLFTLYAGSVDEAKGALQIIGYRRFSANEPDRYTAIGHSRHVRLLLPTGLIVRPFHSGPGDGYLTAVTAAALGHPLLASYIEVQQTEIVFELQFVELRPVGDKLLLEKV